MPKVSQQYRDARRAQILEAAKRCFVRNGFHQTSMQDLLAEAGLSAGAVYRYFASKDEMILAIAEQNLHDVLALLDSLAAQPDGVGLGDTLASVLELIRAKNADDPLGPIALLVWAETVRNPAVAQRFRSLFGQLRTDLSAAVARQQQRGTLPAGDSDGLAALLLAIVPGFILQLTLYGADPLAGVPDAVRELLSATSR